MGRTRCPAPDPCYALVRATARWRGRPRARAILQLTQRLYAVQAQTLEVGACMLQEVAMCRAMRCFALHVPRSRRYDACVSIAQANHCKRRRAALRLGGARRGHLAHAGRHDEAINQQTSGGAGRAKHHGGFQGDTRLLGVRLMVLEGCGGVSGLWVQQLRPRCRSLHCLRPCHLKSPLPFAADKAGITLYEELRIQRTQGTLSGTQRLEQGLYAHRGSFIPPDAYTPGWSTLPCCHAACM